MLISDKTNEEICSEVINSNLSDKTKIKVIQVLKDDKKVEENDKTEEMIICD